MARSDGSTGVPGSVPPSLMDADRDSAARQTIESHAPVGPVARSAGVVAISYFLAARVGEALAFPSAPVSALWAPNAILFAALLLAPVQRWWIYLLAVLPVHVMAQLSVSPLEQVLIQYVVNCAEALLGAFALQRFQSQPRNFNKLSTMANLIVIGSIAAPLLTSVMMAGAFVALELTEDFGLTATARTVTNTFATLTLVPLIAHGATRIAEGKRQLAFQRRAVVEGLAIAACLIVVGVAVFVVPEMQSERFPALLYAPLPFLLWATVRFGTIGACASVLLVGSLSTWGVLHGHGPFVTQMPVQNALSLVFFLVVTCVPLLLLSAVLQERKETQMAREKMEALHRAVLNSLEDQIAVLDNTSVVLEVNESWRRACERSDLKAHLLPGQNYLASTTDAAQRGDPTSATVCADLNAVLSGVSARREFEFSVRCFDGTHWFEQSIESLRHPEGGAVVTLSNVTARKRAELEVQEQHKQLAHLARMAVLGEYSGAITHEICQPLTAILSNAEAAILLLDTPHIDVAALGEILREIVADNLRGVEVIRRLRSMLRNVQIQRRPLQLNELAAETLALVRGDLARRRVTARVELEPDLPRVESDRVQIQQVILNLIVNACDAMADIAEEARRLTLTTRRTMHPAGVELIVRDRGGGIEEKPIERIFRPFETTKSDGLGLGLSICDSIMRAHDGRIWAENLDDGAAFHIVLPIRQGCEES